MKTCILFVQTLIIAMMSGMVWIEL